MILAIEDSLSEAVVRKLVSIVRPELQVDTLIGRRGKDYLKSKARELNKTARSVPVFLLIDQDRLNPCPADIIKAWLTGIREPNLLFRVAVMEVESWVMADRAKFADFLGIQAKRIPLNTDMIERPKEFLVDLARRSRKRRIREDLTPIEGAVISIGPAYNMRLSSFINDSWDPRTACNASPSLRKSLDRVEKAFIK